MSKIIGKLAAAHSRVMVVALVVVAASLGFVSSALAIEGPSELSTEQLTSLTTGAKEGAKSIVSTIFSILPYVLLIAVAMFAVGWLLKKFGFKKQSA
ncbi:MAG TPA: hypothetical protein VFW38_01950 [Solirubrobacteraceae bacterium]|nr:hypothetical protein [Solirubrobacteraceae bacterium]